MDSGVVFYVPGVALTVVLALKARSLKDTWRDPLIASSNAILLIGAVVCILSAPPTITVVNAATGISNFSAPLVYCGMTALSGGYLVLMTAWRGGPRHRLDRRILLIASFCTAVVVGIVVLFALADVPVERTRDLDTYYAGTPYMREMILLYLAFHSVASLLLTGMCLSWVRAVTGITRTGLVLVVIGACFDLSFQAAKYTAMAARWSGRDWDFLSTDVSPPLVATAGIFVATGFALPRLGPSVADSLRARRRCRLLRPLWAEVRGLPTPTGAGIPWWTPPVVRLTQQEIAILDGVLACGPYLDPEVRDTAYAGLTTPDGAGNDGAPDATGARDGGRRGGDARRRPHSDGGTSRAVRGGPDGTAGQHGEATSAGRPRPGTEILARRRRGPSPGRSARRPPELTRPSGRPEAALPASGRWGTGSSHRRGAFSAPDGEGRPPRAESIPHVMFDCHTR